MKLITALLMSSLWAIPCIASPEEANKEDINNEEQATSGEDSEYPSLQNRKGKTFAVLGEVGGGFIGSAGLNLDYFITEKDLLELYYVSGSFDLFAKVEYSLAGLVYQRFVGNSFYLRTGLVQRSIDFSEGVIAQALGSTSELQSNATSMGLEFGIGNRWQWDNFTLGCTWIGWFAPLSTSTKRTQIPSSATQTEIDEFDSDLDKLGKAGHLQFLRLSMGVAF